MSPRRLLASLVACVIPFALLAQAPPEKPKPEPDAKLLKALTDLAKDIKRTRVDDVNEVSLEVSAFRRLFQFNLTRAQLDACAKLAEQVTEPPRERSPGKASEDYRRALADVRDALASEDGDSVADFDEKLGQLLESDTPAPELDDGVEIVDSARKLAPQALKLLKPGQIAVHLSQYGDGLPDPHTQLMLSLSEARSLNPQEWREQRDGLCDPVADALAGLDQAKAQKLSERIMALLLHARELDAKDFEKEKPELEKRAKQIVGAIGPLDVLRHQVERDLAEFLSNPKTRHAIKAYLAKREPGK